ncbi:unnamed protein product [Brachionus calyciflorus]|uniref:non-specific serine/threonine protein kinase n=1 Tax=Brachionus calyciflorus TaxID=104777 RepID=A0A813Z871_9BILA|nr:unnamed protein product [Brachionus calyciflorus]
MSDDEIATVSYPKGELLKNGQYVIIDEIGEGGFGKVYLVEDTNNANEKRALKILTRNLLDNDELLYTIDEINLLRDMENNFIIKYYDCFRHDHKACLVTNYCEGGDLDDKIDAYKTNKKQFTEEQIYIWLCQMLDGLSYLHNRNIIHRDIKPANIFLHENLIKLGDLGLARSLASIQKSSKFAGTINYLCPELIENNELYFASDIWSVGCVLYELICLKMAFDGRGYYQIIKAIVEKDPPKIETSPRLQFVLNKTLMKLPDDRLSADALLDFLKSTNE